MSNRYEPIKIKKLKSKARNIVRRNVENLSNKALLKIVT